MIKRIWNDSVLSKVIANAIWEFRSLLFSSAISAILGIFYFIKNLWTRWSISANLIYWVILATILLAGSVPFVLLYIKIKKINNDVSSRYSKIIDQIGQFMYLDNWENLTSYFIEFIMPDKYVDGSQKLGLLIFKTIWPKSLPKLEAAINNLEKRNSDFVNHFISGAEKRENGSWFEDKSWRRIQRSHTEYAQLAAEQAEWERVHIDLLFNVCIAINEFATSVRNNVNKDYFIEHGEFVIIDSLGNSSEMVPTVYKAIEYKSQ